MFGLGLAVQRLRPLSEQTLTQLSWLVVEVLLPFYLFYTTATTRLETLRAAPLLVVLGVVVPLYNYLLATFALRPSDVTTGQRSAFRFAVMIANTAFIGFPVCAALFGPTGLIYGVMYDFGTTLVMMTFGIHELNGGRFDNWRPLVFNPLIGGVIAGLLWSFTGWSLPDWFSAPLSEVGKTTLPMALLVGGAQIGNIRSSGLRWWRQIVGLTITRLILCPLILWGIFALIGWHDLRASIVIIMAAMPVGLTSAIFAKNYGADAEFAAMATFWSTLAVTATLPVILFLLT